jgi:hypothetical protein
MVTELEEKGPTNDKYDCTYLRMYLRRDWDGKVMISHTNLKMPPQEIYVFTYIPQRTQATAQGVSNTNRHHHQPVYLL